MLITKIPDKISMSSSYKYNNDLVELFKLFDGPMSEYDEMNDSNAGLFNAWLDPYAYYDYTVDIRNFSFDIADLYKDDKYNYYKTNLSKYNSINFRNFKTTMKLQNNSISLNSYINSDLLNTNIDFVFDLANAKINRCDIRLTNLSPLMDKYIDIIQNENDIELVKVNNDIHVNISGGLDMYGNFDNLKIDGVNFKYDFSAKHQADNVKPHLRYTYQGFHRFWSEKKDIPDDVMQLIEGGYVKIPQTILDQWSFQFNFEGDKFYMTATSLEKMPGGAGNQIHYDTRNGMFYGYGQKNDIKKDYLDEEW